MTRKYISSLCLSAGEAGVLLLTCKGKTQPVYSHFSSQVPTGQEVLQETLSGMVLPLIPESTALCRFSSLQEARCPDIPKGSPPLHSRLDLALDLALWFWTPANLQGLLPSP